MTNDIIKSIYTITEKYIDPQTKIPFNRDNPDINPNIKDIKYFEDTIREYLEKIAQKKPAKLQVFL